MRISGWMKKLTRFGALDGADKWLLLRTVAWLAISRSMLLVIPIRRLAPRLSTAEDSDQPDVDPAVLSRVAWAVAAAANNVPWRSDCFPQTIAAQKLLKGYGYASTIHIGVERIGDDDLTAHAWLTSGNVVVTGPTDLSHYTELL